MSTLIVGGAAMIAATGAYCVKFSNPNFKFDDVIITATSHQYGHLPTVTAAAANCGTDANTVRVLTNHLTSSNSYGDASFSLAVH
ncbi:hypothetical protein OG730_00020 [Streptomyces sp. NBC_01298]|uniref:hypothetical protein n=1 Tax=Streptomyces sp. NBC_01298 TaxID=2903817 RepID=UPI002E10F11A|nr:hypothetical protein OG730_00020 [Streptomyces sp. NBC_01298]